VGGFAALLVLLTALILIPTTLPFMLRLVVACALAIAATIGVLDLFRRRSLQAARPEKIAIMDSARITNFSWRATTFELANDTFAEHFAELNETKLMEV
jgi:hypothetical protein